jgi:hypothetical protein
MSSMVFNLLLPGVSPAPCESDSLRAEVSRDNDASFESDCFVTGDLLGVGLDKGLGATAGTGSGE